MKRQNLVTWNGFKIPEDSFPLFQSLESTLPSDDIEIQVPGGMLGPITELGNAGREVWLLFKNKPARRDDALALLWSQVVPLGLTPWMRYPISHSEDHVFHVFGCWQIVYDRLIAEGRGHHAWTSLCVAALCDVGAWTGNKLVERSVQTQLHRIGHSPGAIDGRIGDRTLAALRAAGLGEIPLKDSLGELNSRKSVKVPRRARKQGHIVLPGIDFSVHSFGGVTHLTQPGGAGLGITGPGRVVIDVR